MPAGHGSLARWHLSAAEERQGRPSVAGGAALAARCRLGQAGITLRATVAETSSWSLTDTSWVPSDLIGLPITTVRLSTGWPEVAASASAMSAAVTAPN